MRQAVERSSRQAISRVSLSEGEEDALIQLVARLEGIELTDKEPSDGSRRSRRQQQEELSSMSRSDFLKKLIADNRASMKHNSEMQHLSAERVAARLRGSIKAQEVLATSTPPNSVGSTTSTSASKAPGSALRKAHTKAPRPPLHAPPPPPSARGRSDAHSAPPIAKAPSSVRVSASCMKAKAKGGGDAKILVVQRDTKVADLLALLRGKFNASSKYNAILWGSERALLRDADLEKVNDGDSIILTALSKQELESLANPPDHKDKVAEAGSQSQDGDVTEAISSDAIGLEQIKKEQDVLTEENVTVQESDVLECPVEGSQSTVDVVKDRSYDINGDAVAVVSEANSTTASLKLKEAWFRRRKDAEASVAADRQTLPIHAKREEIVSSVRQHKVVLIAGATGSGKTTQVPQYILEDMILDRDVGSECYIVCTQPRRVAAVSVAERVAYETNCLPHRRAKPQGECASTARDDDDEILNGLVGYQVRLETSTTMNTRLLFCTAGVLLNKLQSPDFLGRVSHIVLDEVHERGVESDFLMAILKRKITENSRLRLVLMSATMQEEMFSKYFNNCPLISVEGRTFPVALRYLDDAVRFIQSQRPGGLLRLDVGHNTNRRLDGDASSGHFDADVVADLVAAIINAPIEQHDAATRVSEPRGNCILVFLSGIGSIQNMSSILNRKLKSRDLNKNISVLMLHGSMTSEHQRLVFRPTRPGEWKIVLTTNIAETSITVDDVTHVIDTGLMKEMHYNPVTSLSALSEVFISRSNAKQRAGRAGRVRAGTCWRMYSKESLETNAAEFPVPEMLRISLEDVVLQVLLLQLGRPEAFLGECLQPPSIGQIRAAVASLIEAKAVLPEPSLPLTALGFHLARLPVDIKLGKMLIFACLLECVDPVLTIAAMLTNKSPLSAPSSAREKAKAQHVQFLSDNASVNILKKLYPLSYPDHSASSVEVPSSTCEAVYSDVDAEVDCCSDFIAVVQAYDIWDYISTTRGSKEAANFCKQYFLSASALGNIKSTRDHYRRHLISAGFINCGSKNSTKDVEADTTNEGVVEPIEDEDRECDATWEEPLEAEGTEKVATGSGRSATITDPALRSREARLREWSLVRCALCAGLFPNAVRALPVHNVRGKGTSVKYLQKDRSLARLHPSSLLCGRSESIIPAYALDAYLLYFYRTAAGSEGDAQLFDATRVPHEALLMFGGGDVAHASSASTSDRKSGIRVQINGWIELTMEELHLACFRRVQAEVEALLVDKVEEPRKMMHERQRRLSDLVSTLLSPCH